MLGMYGSRIELECSSSSAELYVNGSLSVGMADDVYRSDHFELEMDGVVEIIYDQDLLQAAVDGLGDLELDLDLSGSDEVVYNAFSLNGMVSGDTVTGHAALAEYHSTVAAGGVSGEYGVDSDLFASH